MFSSVPRFCTCDGANVVGNPNQTNVLLFMSSKRHGHLQFACLTIDKRRQVDTQSMRHDDNIDATFVYSIYMHQQLGHPKRRVS
jgi:hypothetical protein